MDGAPGEMDHSLLKNDMNANKTTIIIYIGGWDARRTYFGARVQNFRDSHSSGSARVPPDASSQKSAHSRSLLPYSKSLLTLVWSAQALFAH